MDEENNKQLTKCIVIQRVGTSMLWLKLTFEREKQNI